MCVFRTIKHFCDGRNIGHCVYRCHLCRVDLIEWLHPLGTMDVVAYQCPKFLVHASSHYDVYPDSTVPGTTPCAPCDGEPHDGCPGKGAVSSHLAPQNMISSHPVWGKPHSDGLPTLLTFLHHCIFYTVSDSVINRPVIIPYEDQCARSRYQGQSQVMAFHSIP